MTQETFGYMPLDGTAGNAYRHALWNALLKQYFGNGIRAKIWTSAHEAYSEKTLTSESWLGYTRKEHTEMDLHNNAVGLSSVKWYEFWLSDNEISDRIMQHLNDGDMMILVDDGWKSDEEY